MNTKVVGAVAVSKPEWKGVQIGAQWVTIDRNDLKVGHTEAGYYPAFHGREITRISLGRLGTAIFGACRAIVK